jgi:hypothetical protein
MFRFTIRDVLWLTLVAALIVGWWIDSRVRNHAQAALRTTIEEQKVEMAVFKAEAISLRVREAELAIQLKQTEVENVRLQMER